MSDLSYCHRVRCLYGMIPYLLARDVRPAQVLRAAGLSPLPLDDPDAWISRASYLALINEGARAGGDPFLGLHVAEVGRLERGGEWGEAILRAPTLRHGLQAASRGLGLLHRGLVAHLSEEGSRARVSFAFAGRIEQDPRQFVEGSMVIVLSMLRLTRIPAAVGVSFAHSRPRGAAELERVFGRELHFECPGDALVFPRELLDAPIHSSDVARAQSAVSDNFPIEDLVLALYRGLLRELPYDRPTIQSSAARLGLPVRTLQRRLARWGIPFEVLLDDVCRLRAVQLLGQGKHSMTDVAFLLGYSDAAHFTRAFRRWTGMPPRRFATLVRGGETREKMGGLIDPRLRSARHQTSPLPLISAVLLDLHQQGALAE